MRPEPDSLALGLTLERGRWEQQPDYGAPETFRGYKKSIYNEEPPSTVGSQARIQETGASSRPSPAENILFLASNKHPVSPRCPVQVPWLLPDRCHRDQPSKASASLGHKIQGSLAAQATLPRPVGLPASHPHLFPGHPLSPEQRRLARRFLVLPEGAPAQG